MVDWTGLDLPPSIPGKIIALRDENFEFTYSRIGDPVVVYPGTLTKVLIPSNNEIHTKTIIWMGKTSSGCPGYVPVELVHWISKEKDLKRLEVIL